MDQGSLKSANKMAAFCRAMRKLGLWEIKSETNRGCHLTVSGQDPPHVRRILPLLLTRSGVQNSVLGLELSVEGYRLKVISDR